MPVTINNPGKKFGVKFIKKDEYIAETMTVDATGRTGAKDEVLSLYPGAEILDCWEDGNFRVRTF